jgi:Ca-activated chloride channel homolog
MASIIFTNPSYLWMFLIVPFLIIVEFLSIKKSKTSAILFSNYEAIERVLSGDILGATSRSVLRSKNIAQVLLRALVYTLLILSVAGTSLVYNATVSKFDYVFTVDTSSSMLAEDFEPNRLEAAKLAASSFAGSLPEKTNYGIVTFASTSVVNLRMTSDLAEALSAIENIELQQTGGTAIGDAIITATNVFDPANEKSIILITDGQSNVGTDPIQALVYAKENNVVIHSIGVATKEGGMVSNLNLLSKIDEEFLRALSNETDGRFFIVEDINSLDEAFKSISSPVEKDITVNISWILLLAGIVLLGLEWILINTIFKTIP